MAVMPPVATPDAGNSPQEEENLLALPDTSALQCAYDKLYSLANAGKREEARDFYAKLTSAMSVSDCIFDALTAAAVYQLGTWLYVETSAYSSAIENAVKAFSVLSKADKAKNTERTRAIVAALLYDYAIACHAINSAKKAEKALTKSERIYEALLPSDSRYMRPLAYVAAASTEIYRSRIRQLNALAHFQTASLLYRQSLKSGDIAAAQHLIESVAAEAATLFSIGKYRLSVNYYTKAIRYCRSFSGMQTEQETKLSLRLAEALLYLPRRRDTANKLIDTLRRQAEEANDNSVLGEIDKLLEKEDMLRFNIFSHIRDII